LAPADATAKTSVKTPESAPDARVAHIEAAAARIAANEKRHPIAISTAAIEPVKQ
jgi:hypothetical protein